MKRKLFLGSLMVTLLGLSLTATASAAEWDCFPLCAEPTKTETNLDTAAEVTTVEVKLDPVLITAHREASVGASPATSCDSALLKAADDINDKVKPIREIIGYVRSPQGLVIKLVNDHVVKIPAWIGYAIDPLGSLKHKVVNEVRAQARGAINGGSSCASDAAGDFSESVEAVDEKHSA